MEIIPAIDLKDGRCVRLVRGDYDQETVYSQEPADGQVLAGTGAEAPPGGSGRGKGRKPVNLEIIKR